MRPETYSTRPVKMWYEVVDGGNHWGIVYHPEWQDERHPNLLIHVLYGIYRAARYGFPLRDVEYVQIDVNKADGRIDRIRYETSPQDDFYAFVSEHWLVYIDRSQEGYLKRITTAEGVVVRPPTIVEEDLSALTNLRLGVVTWNHLSKMLVANSPYTEPVPFPLRHLDEKTYRLHKYARKSQGDYATPDTMLPVWFLSIAFFLALRLARARRKDVD